MRLNNLLAAGLAAVLLITPLAAQISNVLFVTAPEKIEGKRNEVVTADFKLQLRTGFHVNSNTPSDDYLIPLKFTFAGATVQAQEVTFPKPRMEKYPFSAKPLSVFTGDFKTTAKFKILPTAPLGQSLLTGKLRYQACSHTACLPPKTVDIKVPVEVKN
ncbi:MAG TPA: protein-disulfide reductase DsbD domain-containing protein [Bryobacteraceae bacterium]|nr:protein-disulfide reductase DsbD domain-containing protein [Bryobacteraceae bacterium]